MPKRSKGRADDLVGGLGDEDYDWIKYLGEGRSPASPSVSSAADLPSSATGGSGRGSRPAAPARRQPPPDGDDSEPGLASSGPGDDSPPRRRGHDSGRRRGRDRGQDRQPSPPGRSALADDKTPPGGYGAGETAGRGRGGYGVDDHGLLDDGPDVYGAIGPAAYGTGGRGAAGHDPGGRETKGRGASGPGATGSGAAGAGAVGSGPAGWARPAGSAGYGGSAAGYGGSRGSVSDSYGGREPAGSASGGRRGGTGSSDSRTTPGRAVRLTACRAIDLQANPADALFNPAAEEYGQPLYAVPDRPATGPGRPGQAARVAAPYPDETDPRWPDERNSGWPGPVPTVGGRNRAETGRRGPAGPAGPESRLDTGEFSRPLYSVHDTDSRTSPGSQREWLDDPFADTDGGRRAGTGPQRALREDPFADTDRGRRAGTGPQRALRDDRFADTDGGRRAGTGPQRALRDDRFADTDGGRRAGTGPQRPAIGPEATGWPEFGDGPATASLPDASAGTGLGGGHGTAIWPEATGWPETEEEQASAPAPWSEPTGWPEGPDEAAFPLDDDFGRAGTRAGRTGPQPRVRDRDSGSGAQTDGTTRQFDLAGGAAAATGAGAAAAAPATGRKQDKPKQSDRRQAAAARKEAGRKARGRKAAGGRKKAGVRPEAAIANTPQPAVTGLLDRPDDAEATSTGPLAQPAPAAGPTGALARPAPATTGKQPNKTAPAKGHPRGRRRFLLAGMVVILALAAAAAYVVLRPKTSHAVSTPPKLGSFTRLSANARAEQFKHRLLAAAGGDVKNVVAAVYQRSTGPGTTAVPQIVVFIGGNLAGNTSASGLISAYVTQMHGSFRTSPGALGGEAACAPGSSGGPAECAWADGDTFGVVVSATLSSTALASEMRQMRPLIEHVSK